jgi:putative peptidoglycan lipid II flippase
MVLLLWHGARRMGDVTRFDARFRRRLPRIVLASLVMGGALWAGALALHDPLYTPWVRYGALAVLVGGGGAVFFAAAHLLGGLPLSDLRAAFRRSGKPTAG